MCNRVNEMFFQGLDVSEAQTLLAATRGISSCADSGHCVPTLHRSAELGHGSQGNQAKRASARTETDINGESDEALLGQPYLGTWES